MAEPLRGDASESAPGGPGNDTAGPARRLTLADWELRPRDGDPAIRGRLRFIEDTRPRTAVVVCHGFKGFQRWGFFPALAAALAARGHAALTFDFSHSGVGPDGVDFSALHLFAQNTHSRNVDEIHEVLGAVRSGTVVPEAPERIGLLGHSRGGAEALLAAAEGPGVDALVTWAAIASVQRWSEAQVERWRRGETVEIPNQRTGQAMPIGPAYWTDAERNRERLDVVAAAARVAAPWLIVHGEGDETVDVAESDRLFDAATGRTELLHIADAGHTFGARHPFDEVPPHLRIAIDATLRWFDTFLAAPDARGAGR